MPYPNSRTYGTPTTCLLRLDRLSFGHRQAVASSATAWAPTPIATRTEKACPCIRLPLRASRRIQVRPQLRRHVAPLRNRRRSYATRSGSFRRQSRTNLLGPAGNGRQVGGRRIRMPAPRDSPGSHSASCPCPSRRRIEVTRDRPKLVPRPVLRGMPVQAVAGLRAQASREPAPKHSRRRGEGRF